MHCPCISATVSYVNELHNVHCTCFTPGCRVRPYILYIVVVILLDCLIFEMAVKFHLFHTSRYSKECSLCKAFDLCTEATLTHLLQLFLLVGCATLVTPFHRHYHGRKNSAHTSSLLLQFSFARNGGEELVKTCSDDSGLLRIALAPSQSHSRHAN